MELLEARSEFEREDGEQGEIGVIGPVRSRRNLRTAFAWQRISGFRVTVPADYPASLPAGQARRPAPSIPATSTSTATAPSSGGPRRTAPRAA